MINDIALYKELISFCGEHASEIDLNFSRKLDFLSINDECYQKMYVEQRNTSAPLPPMHFKEIIPGLAELYKEKSDYYMSPRYKYRKGMDIQLGQWYEKALRLFLDTKEIKVVKKGFPFPDFEVSYNGKVLGYYELKFIEAPFLSANNLIKDPYPYSTKRYDYEASLTLDTGEKLARQREKIENALLPNGYMVHYIWWFDCFHIKGVFAMDAKSVFDYYDHLPGDIHQRKTREGDTETHQETGKIYPPLLNMIPLSEYISIIKG